MLVFDVLQHLLGPRVELVLPRRVFRILAQNAWAVFLFKNALLLFALLHHDLEVLYEFQHAQFLFVLCALDAEVLVHFDHECEGAVLEEGGVGENELAPFYFIRRRQQVLHQPLKCLLETANVIQTLFDLADVERTLNIGRHVHDALASWRRLLFDPVGFDELLEYLLLGCRVIRVVRLQPVRLAVTNLASTLARKFAFAHALRPLLLNLSVGLRIKRQSIVIVPKKPLVVGIEDRSGITVLLLAGSLILPILRPHGMPDRHHRNRCLDPILALLGLLHIEVDLHFYLLDFVLIPGFHSCHFRSFNFLPCESCLLLYSSVLGSGLQARFDLGTCLLWLVSK